MKPTPDGTPAHRVVVVGGRLRRAPLSVTLVDRSTNHVFQPMLYQCPTGIVSSAVIAPPLRVIFARSGLQLDRGTARDAAKPLDHCRPIEACVEARIARARPLAAYLTGRFTWK